MLDFSAITASMARLQLLSPPAPQKPPPTYLPHLDGLRAVALIGVLLFHFDAQIAKGGFAGVDCFLVLSGFLITRNILRDVSNHDFSFTKFYKRRFWRLYPAALFTCLLALILAFFLSPPDLSLITAKSALASMFFSSNVFFFTIADYFDNSAIVKPLLHMWSLSLEEQFYFFWPFIVVKASSRQYMMPLVVIILTASSFLLSLFLEKDHSSFVFYMLPCRVYEFGAGALCALSESTWNRTQNPYEESFTLSLSSLVQNMLSLFSISFIGFSFYAISPDSSLLYMMPVVLGTMVIIATPGSIISRLFLANPFMRFLGATSYSAYLMHWVFYVFVHEILEGLGLGKPAVMLMILLTLFSAVVLRTMVEDRMRRERKIYLGPLVALFSLSAFLGSTAVFTKGWRFRFDGMIITQDDSLRIMRNLCIDIDPSVKRSLYGASGCYVGDHDGNDTDILVMGDSFAQHLIPALDTVGKIRGERYEMKFAMGCPLYAKNEYWMSIRKPICRDYTHIRNWEYIDNLKEKKTFLVANSWGYTNHEAHSSKILNLQADLKKRGHKMIIASEPPGIEEQDHANFACLDLQQQVIARLLRRFYGERWRGCVPNYLRPRKNREIETQNLKRLAKKRFYFINIFDKVCQKQVGEETMCRPLCAANPNTSLIDNFGYERDGFHLNVDGSRYLVGIYEQALGRIFKLGGYSHVSLQRSTKI